MKISVVTTCFNSVTTIERTILSVRHNSPGEEVEHIITDAGSTDGTLAIIEKYRDSLSIIPAEGLNQSQGINAGLKAAGGEIVAFLNADDIYQPQALSKVTSLFNANPDKRWLIGRCKIIDQNDQEMQSWITGYKNLLLSIYSYPLLLTENLICQPAVFLKRSLLADYGYFAEDQNLVMDYEYWLRIGAKESPIISDEYLAGFRRFTGTKSNSNFVRQFKDDREIARKYALKHGYSWTIPLKYLNYLKTIGIYKFLYS